MKSVVRATSNFACRTRIGVMLLWLVCSLVEKSSGQEAEFSLILRGGKVVDGTGNPWFMGDIAVKGDRIVAMGHIIGSAEVEIDANDLVISPGFIDIHSHSDWTLFEDGNAQSKIRQGVTTEVLGEGTSGGPNKKEAPTKRIDVDGHSRTISTLADYFVALENACWSASRMLLPGKR